MKKLAFLILSLFMICSVSAQVTTSSMSGNVTDAGKAPLVGATVVVEHVPSGTRYGVAVDSKGNYRIYNLRPGGPYKVSFSMIGYQPVEKTGIQLPLGENYLCDAQLNEEAVGLDAVIVAVDGKNSVMNTERAGAVTSIDRAAIAATPTVSRSMNDVMRLSPQSFTLPRTGFAVGGGNFRQSYVTVDGAAFNNAFGIGENLPAGGLPISLDALEQISVSVTPFDVRQSGFTGGAINAVTRSGDNEFRGSFYTYLTNSNLRGDKIGSERLSVDKAQDYTYGITLGGPIVKNKLFFFVNGEYNDILAAGSDRLARPDDKTAWGSGTNFNRPLVADMDKMRSFLIDKYGYDPGIYQGYSTDIPGYKILARLDWNINANNHLNVRFSRTATKTADSPSTSRNPMTTNDIFPGNKGAGVGAGQSISSNYMGLFFKNSCYYQEENFTSVAAEWNARWLDGRLNNTLRFTYSNQNDPRSYDGGAFPTVEILKDGAGYMYFGTEFFTEGNLRKVNTFVVTDEFSYNTGINNLIFGLQYEHNQAENGYMQGANGYYVFDSMESFMNGSKPSAFGITHSNSPDLSQFIAKMKYAQYSAYVQDEINFSRNFKMTAGVRFEIPVYPSLKNNYNAAYEKLNFGGRHYSTDQVPGARLTMSPRVGFNWDLTGERKYILRGGTGYFVGRLPFVWLVSAVGNSGVGQTQYLVNTVGPDTVVPDFHTNVNDIFKDIYPNGFNGNEPTAPSIPTIIDKNLKMPATWKSSLAMDIKLPGDVDLTVEGVYSRDYHAATVVNKNIYANGYIKLTDNDIRTKYSGYNSQGCYYITNSDEGLHNSAARYYSINTQLHKSFWFGLDVLASYTYSNAKSYNDGLGSQVTSAYRTNTYSVNGVNDRELGYGTYVTPHRVLISVNYRKAYAKHFATAIGLLYEGSQIASTGGYFYSRYSYTFSGNVVGDGGANNLLYIPSDRNELDTWNFVDITDKDSGKVTYSAKDQRDDFWTFIEKDDYLKGCKGKYTERGGATAPWHSQLDLKFRQEFFIKTKGGYRNAIVFGVDIQNFANLLNSEWGNYKTVNTTAPIAYKDGVFSTNKVGAKRLSEIETFSTFNNLYSTYRVMFSVAYKFN